MPATKRAMTQIKSKAPLDLGTRACLIRLKMQRWDEFVTDQVVTDEVQSSHKVTEDMVRVRKRLIPSRITRAVSTAINNLRRYHEAHTLPWSDDRYRVLPGALWMQYHADMAGLRDALDTALADFVPVYSGWLTDQVAANNTGVLGDTFNADDYPAPSTIVARYSVVIRPRPFSTASDWRLEVGEESANAIRSVVEAEIQETVDAAMKDIWLRFQDVLTKAAERLKKFGQPKPDAKPSKKNKKTKTETFRDSLLDNVTSLLALVPALNITGDPKITEFAGRVQTEIAAYTPKQLREDEALRVKVTESVEDVLAKMADYL